MRFIHTADWHLGNAMHNIDRKAEAKSFLLWLHDLIAEKKAEALIVSGDVFDTVNPPVWARKLYFCFLASLADTPCCNVVIVGGNHDSGALLDAPKDVLSAINVYTAGTLFGVPVKDVVLPLHRKDGELIGVCAAIPYVRETDIRQFDTENTGGSSGNDNGENGGSFKRALTNLYKEAALAAHAVKARKDVPLIATGHLFAAGLEGRYKSKKEGEADDGMCAIDVLGNLGRVPSDVFGAFFDYVALGHIHYTSMVAGNPQIRYSGSPFVLGFDEAHIARNVLLAESEAGAPVVVEKINVPQSYRFERLSGTVEQIIEQMESIQDEAKQDKKPVFVEIMHDNLDGQDARSALDGIIESAPFTVVSWRRKAAQGGGVYALGQGVQTARELSEKEVFRSLIIAKNADIKPESSEMEALIDEYMPLFMEVADEARTK